MKRFLLLLYGLAFLCPTSAQEDDLQQYLRKYHEARQLKNADSLAGACANLAEYYSQRDADSTLKYTIEGLKAVDRTTPSPYLELQSSMVNYYNSTGDSRKCIDESLFLIKEADRLNASPLKKGNFFSACGVAYRRANMIDSALYYYNKALEIYTEGGEECEPEIPFLLTNISILYCNTRRQAEAEDYIRRALASISDNDDLVTRLYASNTAGAVFAVGKKYAEAEKIMRSSLQIAMQQNMSRFILQCASPLLSLYAQTGNRKALDDLDKEIQPWLRKLPAKSNEVLGYYEVLADIYSRDKRYEESNALYGEIIRAGTQNMLAPLQYVYLRIARNMAAMNRAGEASQYYERTVTMMDSLHESNIERQMSDFSVRYETQQKELEIVRLNAERLAHKNRTMKWGFATGAVFLGIIMWLIYDLFRRRQQRHKAELKVARSFIDGLEKERTRLAKELHDGICNDLLGVGMMLSQTDNNKEIVGNVEEIRAEVRAISHELTPPKFQYATLDELVGNMIDELFSDEKIRVEYLSKGDEHLWKKVPERVSYEVYRIVQELSSNIILHSGATRTQILLEVTSSQIVLDISNDGKEFSEKKFSRCGIGFSTIRERLISIEGHLAVTYENGEQHFNIVVPISKN